MFELHNHHKLVHYFKNKEMDEVYASVFLRNLANSLISIFVPIYLLQLGYSFEQVIIFFLVHVLVLLFVFPLGFKLTTIFGIKKLIVFGTVLNVVYYLLLYSIESGIHYLVPAVIGGLSTICYWSGFHLEFAHNADKHKEGREYSVQKALAMGAVTVGPLLGAFFIIESSFQMIFVVVSFLMFLSIVPFFFTNDYVFSKTAFNLRSALSAGSFTNAVSHYAEGIGQFVGGIFWPLFIYVTLESVVSLGMIISFTSVLMIFFILWIGKRADNNERTVLTRGVFFRAPIWIVQLFFLSPVGLFFTNFFKDLASQAIVVPFGKLVYEKAGKTSPANYMCFREIHLAIGKLALLFFALATLSYNWIFILAAASTFLYLAPLKKS